MVFMIFMKINHARFGLSGVRHAEAAQWAKVRGVSYGLAFFRERLRGQAVDMPDRWRVVAEHLGSMSPDILRFAP